MKTTFMFRRTITAAFAIIPIVLACSADDTAEVSGGGSPINTTGEAGADHEGSTPSKAGASSDHPLVPQGGDTPNPVGPIATFTVTGVFGYECIPHPSEMNGAIEVVPERLADPRYERVS